MPVPRAGPPLLPSCRRCGSSQTPNGKGRQQICAASAGDPQPKERGLVHNRRLSPNSMKLALQCPDGSHVPLEGAQQFGRAQAHMGFTDTAFSKEHFTLVPVEGLQGVRHLECLGQNPLVVEVKRQDGDEWQPTEVLDTGKSTVVEVHAKIYVASRKETTLCQIVPCLEEPDTDAQVRSPKRQKTSAPPAPSQPSPRPLAPFCLLRVRALDGSANAGPLGVHLRDVVHGAIRFAFISNYMVDLPWLLSACPDLAAADQTAIVHGERGSHAEDITKAASQAGMRNVTVHAPPLPIAFGTHHSKAFILAYDSGVRVVVHTANLIYPDCNNKTQGIYWQDFPPKSASSPTTSDFEATLSDYLSALRLPEKASGPLLRLVAGHDFSKSRTWLVPSIPGAHKGPNLPRYGHMRARAGLDRETFPDKFQSAPVVCQFSSIGSIDEKWLLDEFSASLGAGRSEGGAQLGAPARNGEGVQLVWPRVKEVRASLEGFAAGYSIPGNSKNVGKAFLKRHWHRYGGEGVGRQRAMPHIKTYVRYSGSHLAWVLLASHNLSKAAWGCLQKQRSQLAIRSYELGVLFLPSLEAAFWASGQAEFSCTPRAECAAEAMCGADTPLGDCQAGGSEWQSQVKVPGEGSDATGGCGRRVEFRTMQRREGEGVGGVGGVVGVMNMEFPLPYRLPPEPYGSEDQPWVVDEPQVGYDVLGRRWGTPVSYYGWKE